MFRIFYQEMQIAFAEKINRLIFTLKKIKFIGQVIPNDWYARVTLKKVIGIIAGIWAVLWDVICKAGYYLVAIACPVLVMIGILSDSGIDFEAGEKAITWIFFFMNCMTGSLVASKIFNSDEDDYLLLNLLRIDARKHYLIKCFMSHITQIIYYTIFMLIALCKLGDWNVSKVICFMVVYAAFRFIGETLRLKVNVKCGMPFQDKNKTANIIYNTYIAIMVIIGYATYPVLLIFKYCFNVKNVHFPDICAVVCFPAALIVIAAAGIYCIYYLWNYNGYGIIAKRLANYSVITAKTAEVEKVLNKNYEVKVEDISEDEMKSRKFGDKTGYEYLNALFFERHKRLVSKPIKMKVFIASAIFIISTIALVMANILCEASEFKAISDEAWDTVNSLIPILVFIMYMISSGKNLTRAMFYNCDYSLLKYGYYRTSDAILSNFRIRLRYMIKAEMPMVGIISIGVVVDTVLLHKWNYWMQLISIIACVALLAIFYSVVYLCMYYIFQPYTEGGAVTGIGYNVCSGCIYMASYMCLQIHTVPSFFVLIVLGVTVAGLVAAYIIAYVVAPKHFVLK